ncbi:MAG: hypothetical protein EU541_02710 [Promethearchaeota archaeon]|nr:MAG: hypothetical protein EU541_02710 [Candidatus Lokiarchaeota archaeon]
MLSQTLVDIVLEQIGYLGSFFLFLMGAYWLAMGIYEWKIKRKSFTSTKTEEWDFEITIFFKILVYIGFIIGLVSIVAGVAQLVMGVPPSIAFKSNWGEVYNLFTAVLLIILGVFTFLKPLSDLPIASVVGILAASLVTILVAILIPESAKQIIALFIDPKWFFIIFFIILFAIVAVVVKFYIGALMWISKLISWPPLAIIAAALSFVQAFLLTFIGISIF